MAEQWLSVVEYARAFNVSDMTVRRRIKTGKLHAIMKDGKYFIPVPDGKVRQRGAAVSAPAMKTDHGEMAVIKGSTGGQSPYLAPVAPQQQQVGIQTPNHMPSPVHEEFRGVTGIPGHMRERVAESAPAYASYEPVEPTPMESSPAPTPSVQPMMTPARRETNHLPRSLTQPLDDRETTLADTRALLAFCDASLKKFTELERRQVERFKAKLEALEAKLAERDQTVSRLQQQVEDLQVLVKILEGKR